MEQSEGRISTVRKFLFVAGLMIVLSAGWSGVSAGASKNSIWVIREFILSSPSNGFVESVGENSQSPFTAKTLASEENRSNHEHFKWRYDIHLVTLFSGEAHSYLQFQVKEYQEFVSKDSRGFILWTFFDYDMDGEFDLVMRTYHLVMQDNVIMMTEYPQGFVSKEWYDVPTMEAGRRFDREVNYWLEVAKGEHR